MGIGYASMAPNALVDSSLPQSEKVWVIVRNGTVFSFQKGRFSTVLESVLINIKG